jgi:hypothetical protein
MSDIDLDAIRQREAKATKGPWWQGPHYRCDVDSPSGNVRSFAVYTPQAEADAEFIANARTDIPSLLSALEESRAEVARLNDLCATCGHPLSSHDTGPSEDGCRFMFGWGDECACGWPVAKK